MKKSWFFALLCAAVVVPMSPTVAAQDVTAVDPRLAQKQQLIQLLAENYSNFHPLFLNPEDIGNFPPIVQRGYEVETLTGEPAVIIEQGFLEQNQAPYRRQLLTFSLSKRGSDIIQVSYPLATDTPLPTSPLNLQSYERLPGCEVRWIAVETGFEGYRAPRRCYFIDETGQQVHLETNLRASAQGFEMIDAVVNSEGEPLQAEPPAALVLEPIRFLTMDAQFLPAGADPDNADAWLPVAADRWVHDHGQRVNLSIGEQDLPYQLRVVLIPSEPNALQVTVFSVGDEVPVEQWVLEQENGAWSQTEAPLKFTLRVADPVAQLAQ